MTKVVVCASCGTRLRERAKYCDSCGAPTAVTSAAAEFKQVTVLFADVVRSMEIAATVDGERWREIVSELVARSTAVAHRYGGTVEYTGDGVMAVFGAPAALEDHAMRACLTALAIQEESTRLAAEVQRRDSVDLRVRVGLNSGEVIAGDIGAGALGYGVVGRHVGMAQRMEAVAPPGGVMLSESTSRLVERLVQLGEPEWVRIKGADEPVPARRLLAVGARDGPVARIEATLVGRRLEMAALEAAVDRAVGGRGGVVTVSGLPGVGKSRVARETAALASGRGVAVLWVFCESHARDIPFGVVTSLLRVSFGVADLVGEAARAHVRKQLPEADPQDLLLLEDLLGFADSSIALPAIDRDARRRRLTAMINAASLARTTPTLFVVEDAQWIDAVSESMLADFLTVIPRTRSMVLVTYRLEYQGVLTRVRVAQAISIAPLGDTDTAVLLGELLGSDPSARDLVGIIGERAAGNPFFAEEMVRELAQRGVLAGEPGRYVCRTDTAEVSVPATVQAAIEARLDRLTIPGKRTVQAAAVIGARFDARLLAALDIEPALSELLRMELIDQVGVGSAEYAFCHPLIHAVAYESQLKSDRAQWHRRLAAAIQEREPASVEDNAALIAEHLEAGGELHAAYGWHMRAGTWSASRDLGAARVSWERACRIADALPADDPNRLSMRIAPRTMLCATDWSARGGQESPHRPAELRELCAVAGDKVSLAVGLTGVATEVLYAGRSPASAVASEQLTLLESIGDHNLTVGLSPVAFASLWAGGEIDELLRWSQTVVDLAAGEAEMGSGFGIGSPLAAALAWRGVARWWLGRLGWRDDHDDALAMARDSHDRATLAGVVAWTYGLGIQYGVLLVDDPTVGACEDAVQLAEGSSSDNARTLAEYALGLALLHRTAGDDRRRGRELMARAREQCIHERVFFLVPVIDLWVARERAGRGDRDAAIPVMREAVDSLYEAGGLAYGLWGSGVLVEALVQRGAEGDLEEAEEALDRLVKLGAAEGWAIRDITLLRLRALLCRARGEDIAYRDLVDRYRAMAKSLGFAGHIAMAEAMR